MAKKSQGKVRQGPHSTMIPGLAQYIQRLTGWSEISLICIGSKPTYPRRKGRRLNNVSKASARRKAHRGGGGGFRFRAVRVTQQGPHAVGILCRAESGSMRQQVILKGSDLEGLEKRLRQEGLWGN